jgi:hypothetical protein
LEEFFMGSIAQQIAERSEGLTQRAAKADFLKLSHMLLRYGDAFNAAARCEVERCTPRVANILRKAAVTGGTLADWSAISDYENIQQAFQESLRSESVFDAVLNGGMVRAPLRSRGFSVVTGITGGVVTERSVKPISSLVLASQLLEPRKASAIVVVSRELADFPGSAQLFAAELTKGVVAATDNNFLAALIAATTPVPSAGATLANITTDFDVLLSAITTSATSRIYYVASPANMKSIVTKGNVGGQPAYPTLGPNGGELFPGVVAIASDQISSSAALMFAADAIVGNADALVPDNSDQTTLQLETSPDSPPSASTSMLSLWQTDNRALRMERWFGYTVMRASGVSSLSGVAY